MDIRIFSHQSLEEFLSQNRGIYDAVLITNSDVGFLPFVATYAREYLHLQFDDIECDLPPFVSPSKPAIGKALAWSKGRERLAVACHAGISRSSAVAYVIACSQMPPEQAIKILRPGCHMPNELIVSLGSAILENTQVETAFRNWKNQLFGFPE
ncbi:MAG: hypothetical protein KatS3mg105_1063 [Gemmatales bacterium]|nr:MAG: hypothetical protein KatS3mg105_1063 [Gemmatales bacterium]